MPAGRAPSLHHQPPLRLRSGPLLPCVAAHSSPPRLPHRHRPPPRHLLPPHPSPSRFSAAVHPVAAPRLLWPCLAAARGLTAHRISRGRISSRTCVHTTATRTTATRICPISTSAEPPRAPRPLPGPPKVPKVPRRWRMSRRGGGRAASKGTGSL